MDYPLINGVRHDWSSVTFKVDSAQFRGIKALSYEHGMEPGEVMGTAPQVLGVTSGQYKASGSVELYLAEYYDLINILGLSGAQGFFERMFTATAQYSAVGSRIYTDVLNGVRLKKAANDHSSSNDALTVKCDLFVMYVVQDGQLPIGAGRFYR